MKVFIITGRSLFVVKITRQTSKIIRTCRQGIHTMKGPCIFLDYYSLTHT